MHFVTYMCRNTSGSFIDYEILFTTSSDCSVIFIWISWSRYLV